MAASSGPKRPPPPKVNLPDITDAFEYAVEKLANVLRDRSGSQRTPDQTARVLVLLVKMWQSRPPIPFPSRDQVKDHLGVSLPCVDVVLSYRQGTGDISINYETARGNVAGRPHSTVRRRFVVPSVEIQGIVNSAEAEWLAVRAQTKNNPSNNPKPGNPGHPTPVEIDLASIAPPDPKNSSVSCEALDPIVEPVGDTIPVYDQGERAEARPLDKAPPNKSAGKFAEKSGNQPEGAPRKKRSRKKVAA